jgi:pyruvate,water dikinase
MATLDQQPVPTSTPPADFPVTWESPDDAGRCWLQQGQFFPAPITPMTWSMMAETLDSGFNAAAATFGVPIRLRHRRINTYLYATQLPPETVEIDDGHAREALDTAITSLADRWRDDYLPEARRFLHDWEHFDLAGATREALLAHLDETVARRRRLREIEMLLQFAGMAAMSAFDDLYRDLFGVESAFDAYRLLQGFDNKTIETDRALWRLSRQALAVPEVRDAMEGRAPEAVIPALEASTPGQAFLAELRAFLNDYGHRNNLYLELAQPSWVEDPVPAIQTLQGYLSQAEGDPGARMATLAAERERLVAEARERLRGYPQPVVAAFERLLRAAQTATVLLEDHNFWLECRPTHQYRQLILECGRRLARARAIEQVDDVFYLTLDELRPAIMQPHADQRALVAARRAEIERFRGIAPPPMLGTPPPAGPAPEDTPESRVMARMFGLPPQDEPDPHVLHGNAGSPGVARGRAKIIHTLAEAAKLQDGDVLVTRSTVPAWTPLFTTAAAVVTDAGGILSHCAVVAREYRLPAVVGTLRGTALIQDGQLLEVDGGAGIVRILS